MILVEVKPRADERYDIYVGDEGDAFLNSSQGYERAIDAEAIVRLLWPPTPTGNHPVVPILLKVTYRDGTTKTEQLR